MEGSAPEPQHGEGTCIPVQEMKEHLTCGLCMGPLAHSLVLSCSHLFCGDCLLKRLQTDMTSKQQACPTCNMDLRAVPVRCLAMDKVAATIVPSLPREQQQQYAKRCKDGQTAADQVNKMLWWLTPPSAVGGLPGAGMLPPGAGAGVLGGGGGGAPAPGGPLGGLGSSLGLAAATAPMMLGAHGLGEPKASSGLHHQMPFGGALPLPPYGGLGGLGPHLPAPPNAASFLQMAMAAQLAQQAQQAAKVQQQLGAAAAAAAAGLGGHPHPHAHAHHHSSHPQQRAGPAGGVLPDMGGLQHMLLGGQEQAAGGGGPTGLTPLGHLPPATPSPTGYHPDQLSSLMASMCHV